MDRFEHTRQPDWEWWAELWPEPTRVLEQLGVGTNHSLVDIGSGNGYFTLAAGALVDPAPVYAVDIDDELLEELTELAQARGRSNITCLLGDARDLSSILPERVDVALIANTFHGIERPQPVVEQVARSLTDDGRLIVVNWHDRPPEDTPIAGRPRGPPRELRLSPDRTRESLPADSFTDGDVIELPPYHYALVCDRR